MPLKYSTARSSGKPPGSVQASRNGFFIICSVLTTVTVQDRRQHFNLSPSQVRQTRVEGAAEGERNKEESEPKGNVFSTSWVFFIEGIDEMGVGGQRR